MQRYFRLLQRTALIAASLIVAAVPAAVAQPRAEQGTAQSPQAAQTGPGLLVVSVETGSPADKAGIVRGDILLQADGKDLGSAADLQAAIGAHKVGDAISLKVKHGDTERVVSVTLADRNGKPFLGVAPFELGWRMGRDNRAPTIPPVRGNGAYVVSVMADSPAEKAGLKANDVILSVDGKQVAAGQELSTLIGVHKIGDAVTLSVRTPGQQPRDVKVALEKNPNADGPYLGVQYTQGARMPMFNPPGLRGFGANGLQVNAGVLVKTVADDSPASRAGFKPQDLIQSVDGVPVSAPNAVAQAVANHKPGDTMTFSVWRMSEAKDYTLTATLEKAPQGSATAAQDGAYLGITMSRFLQLEGPDTGTAPIAPQGIL
jgi:S1-C subfamily serine protease